MIWFLPLDWWHTGRLRKRDNLLARDWGSGAGKEPNLTTAKKKARPSISHSILSALSTCLGLLRNCLLAWLTNWPLASNNSVLPNILIIQLRLFIFFNRPAQHWVLLHLLPTYNICPLNRFYTLHFTLSTPSDNTGIMATFHSAAFLLSVWQVETWFRYTASIKASYSFDALILYFLYDMTIRTDYACSIRCFLLRWRARFPVQPGWLWVYFTGCRPPPLYTYRLQVKIIWTRK